MRTSLYCFAVDLVGEGVGSVARRARDAGIDDLTVAAVYHEARDYLPHHPRIRVHYARPGVAFRIEEELYPAHVRPAPLLEACEGRDLLDELAREDTGLEAWAVYLHNDGPPGQVGGVRNAWGDEHQGLLCAAHPEVRGYALALTVDLCRPGVRAINAEVLHYLPFEHGFHHERRFAPLTRFERLLLSLCFCEACVALATDAGIDADALRATVKATVGTGAEVDEWSRSAVGAALEGLDAYLRLRERTVAGLARDCASAAAARGVSFAVLDVSAGIAGWADGVSDGPLGAELGWELGLDVGLLEEGRLLAVPYTSDPERVRAEVEAYQKAADVPVDVLLRPMWPDSGSVEDLSRKVAICRALGVGRLGFYHYGMMPLDALDRVRASLAPGA
ncbi:MAG: hypothetical protein EAS51_11350 [Microbacteriaceae bacterium]|nr:MAG: hypothetical protein EAS51_11350 [Microbacteriaceae bacterium]